MNLFVVLVLVAIGFVLLVSFFKLIAMLALVVGRAISRFITMRYLTRQCGSRARANRFVRAVEMETRNNALSSMAPSSLQSRAQTSAGPGAGRSRLAREVSPGSRLSVGSVTR